jgi:hypothetical protein
MDVEQNGYVWTLALENPPVGFDYELYWDLPRLEPSPLYRELNGDAMAARAALAELASAGNSKDAGVQSVLKKYLTLLHEEYQSKYGGEVMDLTLFTFDARSQCLVVVGSAAVPGFASEDSGWEELLSEFRPPVGVSTAGQCFKTGRAVTYEKSQQEKPFSPHLPFGPAHEVLISAPIYLAALYQENIDPSHLTSMEKNGTVVGVLSVGSTSAASGLRQMDPGELEAAAIALVPEVCSRR